MTEEHPFAENASSIWKMLDELAENDPENYKKLIQKQMDVGQSIFSRPKFRLIYKCRMMNGEKLFLNLCEWATVRRPITPEDPVPILYGDKCIIENVSTYFLAFHPTVFDEHGFDANENISPNMPKSDLSKSDLLALSLSYLAKEKHVVTVEYTDMINKGNLPRLNAELSAEPHGGEETMLKSFRYKSFNLNQIAQEALSTSGLAKAPQLEASITLSTNNSEIKTTKKCLIEEIEGKELDGVPLREWRMDERKSSAGISLFYHINLPPAIKMSECELDISRTQLSLKIKHNAEFSKPFITEFPSPVCAEKGIAKFNRKNQKLIVSVPLV